MQTMKGKLLLSVGAFLLCTGCADAVEGTPVQKVITLLQSMETKGTEEKSAETSQYATYSQWCTDTSNAKGTAISEAGNQIDSLTAEIDGFKATAGTVSTEIAGHEDDVDTWTGDKDAATKVRNIEKADYEKANTDLTESVDALAKAIETLEAQNWNRAKVTFLQTDALKKVNINMSPTEATKALDLFLVQGLAGTKQEIAHGADDGSDPAHGYAFQSQAIIDLLTALKTRFTDERTAKQTAEETAITHYDTLMEDLTNQINTANGELETKKAQKSTALENKATKEGELSDKVAEKKADEEYKAETDATCALKASEYEERQTLRAAELQVIKKVLEIMEGDKVTGAANAHLPALVQTKTAALAQLRVATASNEEHQRVAEFLQSKATSLHSRVLSNLADQVAKDPFKKVKDMIMTLIKRLMEEATSDASHKGWCDKELKTNANTRKENTENVETLTAEIEELEASIAQMVSELSKLSQAVTTLDTNFAEAKALRDTEKASNEKAIKDAKDAQTAVADAVMVLKEFYGKAKKATSLVQQTPAIFDSPYKGLQDNNSGVLAMMEVIKSDFARLEEETDTAEMQSAREFRDFTTKTNVDKADKSTSIAHKTVEKEDQDAYLVTKKQDLLDANLELDASNRYYDKLKPPCVDEGVSWEDREAQRQEEIASLQQALTIMEAAPTQIGSR